MPNWAGYDTAKFLYDVPPREGMLPSCNPNGYNLARYTALHYPEAANKYFARYFLAPNFSPFDPAEIDALRAATFFYLMPISAPTFTNLTTSGEAGKQLGRDDATTTLQNIVAALNSGRGLVTPTSGTVYVYLNIEQGYPITAWYWEGWSETVYLYQDPTYGAPFFPGVYANPNDTSTMNMLVGYNNRSDAQHTCYGLWTTQPNAANTNCQWCNNAPPPAWNTTLTPPQPQGFAGLTLHHWQYTIHDVCYPGSGCDSCRPHVDQDQSNPAFDMALYMLRVT